MNEDPTLANSQPISEISQDDWDAVTNEDGAPALDTEVQAEPAQPTEAEAPEAQAQPAAQDAPASTQAAAPADPADPFASLPPEVRALLASNVATISTLQHELRSTVGRVSAIQSELARRTAAPAPEPEAPRTPSKLDALREELPEVAAALEEVTRQRGPSPDELRAEVHSKLMAEFQEELLESTRPTWAQDVVGNGFQTWLATQPAAFQEEVRGATRAKVILGALGQFDAFTKKANERTQQLQRNQSRLTAAVSPGGGARGRPSKSEDDMSDDEVWEHITR